MKYYYLNKTTDYKRIFSNQIIIYQGIRTDKQINLVNTLDEYILLT